MVRGGPRGEVNRGKHQFRNFRNFQAGSQMTDAPVNQPGAWKASRSQRKSGIYLGTGAIRFEKNYGTKPNRECTPLVKILKCQK